MLECDEKLAAIKKDRVSTVIALLFLLIIVIITIAITLRSWPKKIFYL